MEIILIGASNNPDKFGNKILKDLISKGHSVIPVNPKEDLIEGIKVYKNIGDIDNDFEIVNFVVQPEITIKILKDNLELLKKKIIWCQPGASDSKVKSFLIKNDFKDYIIDRCIMIENIKEKNN